MKRIYKTLSIVIYSFISSMKLFEVNVLAAQTTNTILPDNSVAISLQVLFLFTLIALLPSMLLCMTSFTRIIISLHFVRSALGTQSMPPNQILLGLSLFLTLFLMSPVLTQINETAVQPYVQGDINQQQFLENAMIPIREFMFSQVQDKDMELFIGLSGETFTSTEEIPNNILIPAFILGEITQGFKIGFLVYLPFIVIDMVVASILMAMGMMMLPPAMISLPFKVLLFILADGWNLIIYGVVSSFR